MKKTYLLLSVFTLFGPIARAQAPIPPPRPFVVAFGDATVSTKPDEARVQFSVVTQAATAQAASTQNANQVTAVLAAMRSLGIPEDSLKTLSYSLNPNYSTPRDGTQAVIIGYTASNTVEVRISDLSSSLIGRVIDSSIQAGANRVQGLSF